MSDELAGPERRPTAAGYAAGGHCSICSQLKDVRYLPIFAFGSEGVHACNDCDRAIAEHCRQMRRDVAARKKRLIMAGRTAA